MSSLKAITFSLFTICILLSQVNSTVILVNYYLNKEYISKNLCENRDKPQLNCCGKCVVKKELAKENKNESLPGSSKEKESAKQVNEKTNLIALLPATFCNIQFNYSFFIPVSEVELPFQPPRA